MRRISQFIHKLSRGWLALLALLVICAFIALVLPAGSARGGCRRWWGGIAGYLLFLQSVRSVPHG